MAKEAVLVTGASGSIGKAAITALGQLADSLEVKAGVRDPAKSAELAKLGPNVVVVAADPQNSDQIAEALQGVDYLVVITPGTAERPKIVAAAVEAAKAAGTKHILVSSGMLADHPEYQFGKEFHDIEASVKASGIPYTIFRLPMFLDNNFAHIGSIKAQGAFYDSVEPDKGFNSIASQDAGAFIAKILEDPKAHSGQTYKVVGPVGTNAEFAAGFSEALGTPVKYIPVPYEKSREVLQGFGLPSWLINGMMELEELINAESPLMKDPEGAQATEAILGRAPMGFKEWIGLVKPAFL